jgi:tetratricopeptide (TPR) repeat protein
MTFSYAFKGHQRSLMACLLAGATMLAAVGATNPAFAFDENQRAAYDAAFDATQSDPGNANKALAYAEAAIKYGDLEGAVGALERLLIINPDLPRIRLELGVLYYRLQSFALAHTYLERVLETKDLPGDVRAQAEKYLGEIDNQSSPLRISGAVQAGLRWQDNANAAPGLDSLGVGQPIGALGGKTSDWNIFGTLGVNAVYDFQRPDRLVLESNFSLYGQKQFKESLSSLDLWLAQFDIGPRINVPALAEGLSIRPYALVNYLMLQESEYFHSAGGGLNISMPVTDSLFASLTAEIQQRDYRNDAVKYALAEDRSGEVYSLRADTRYALTESQLLGFSASIERTGAHDPGQATWVYALGPAYVARFPFPAPDFNRPVTATVSLQRLWRVYDAPYQSSPFPNDTQDDRQWQFTGGFNLDLFENVGVQVQLQQYWVESNISSAKYDNTTLSTSISYSF